MKRQFGAALVAAILLFSTIALAKPRVITINQFVEHPSLDAVRQGFQDYLNEEMEDIHFIVHNAQANMATTGQIARQQVGEDADIVVALATPSAQNCVQAMAGAPEERKRPVLFIGITDPVKAGLVADLDNPPPLVTGVSDRLPVDRQVAMIREFIGPFTRLGYLYNPGEANSQAVLEQLKELATKEKFTVVEATATTTAGVYQAAGSFAGKVDAVFVSTDNTVISGLEALLKVAEQAKFPVFTADLDSVKRGSVASLGIDYYLHGRQGGAMAKKILNGVKPSQLPVEFQQQLELHVNISAAAAMGVTPPAEMVSRAARVYQ